MPSPFGINADEKVAVFIDGPSLFSATKQAGVEIDYKKLIEHLEDSCKFLRASYFTSVFEDAEEYSPLRPLLDFLSFNGYVMVTKPAREYTNAEGQKRHKTSMSVDLAVAALSIADHVDHLVLFSGEGDFAALVKAIQAKGVRVTVVSHMSKTDSSLISDDLRRQADRYVDIADKPVLAVIARPPKAPAQA